MLDNKKSQPDQKESQGEKFAVTAPVVSLPKGGGAIRSMGEKFAANPVTGSGSMTLPIATSPGRSGFSPQLFLSYDSGAGNGPFGLGWNLSLPQITRKTDKGLPRYQDAEDSDVFILSGTEDLVPVLAEKDGNWVWENLPTRTVGNNIYNIKRYRPRIEGLFARIEKWTNQMNPAEIFWRSISKDNITTWYGKTENSRIYDPFDHSHIFCWLICQSYDDKGNLMVYEYKEENSEGIDLSRAHEQNRTPDTRKVNRYLKRIYYGNRTPYLPVLATDVWPQPPQPFDTDGTPNYYFEAVFDYNEGHYSESLPDEQGRIYAAPVYDLRDTVQWAPRIDPFSTYRAGFEVRTYRLCQRILMFHHFPDKLGTRDCLVRSTDFIYNYKDIKEDDPLPLYSCIKSVSQSGYVRYEDGRYLKKSLPPLQFIYSEPKITNEIDYVDTESLENMPMGLDGCIYQWTDLHGEGVPGILCEQSESWLYKRNLSPYSDKPVEFGHLEQVAVKPNTAINGTQAQFMDLAGDGQPDLVVLSGQIPGLYEHDEVEGWQNFRPFSTLLNINMHDRNLRLVDLNGDGHADILITEEDAVIWHESLSEEGFGPAHRITNSLDEEKGPRLVFADGTESIYLADLSGDGLTDLARIRNGEVCYWPNLGYGRFGAKVTMDNSPVFDSADLFDQKRIRLADIDGSGTTDIIYIHSEGIFIYFNQSGNSWSDFKTINVFPQTDNMSNIMAVDLLGNGTASLVWSSPLPGNSSQPMRYVALMKDKPHMLVESNNNLGARTVVSYASSAKFYIKDKIEGKPWITKLPFPVHVVERIETYDYISCNRFVTRYAYHHGYFDGEEREFRGFGMVEQWDTEEFAALCNSIQFPMGDNIDSASLVPPVLTRTWFHTGAFIDGERISKQFEHEYYLEGDLGLVKGELTQYEKMLLPDTLLPDGLTTDEMREACRALKGSILRQEIYALDPVPGNQLSQQPQLSEESDRPYTVSERNYTIKILQPQSSNRHGVFLTHARETIDYHYERKLYDQAGNKVADPRVTHSMVLETDDYGNALKSVTISYGRRIDDPDKVLTDNDRTEQKKIYITSTDSDYTNAILTDDNYRAPLPAAIRTYEIINTKPESSIPYITNIFGFEEMATKLIIAGDGQHKILYENIYAEAVSGNEPWRRLIEEVRTLYRDNDFSRLLPLKEAHSLALPGESFKLAFTPGLLSSIFKRQKADGTWEELIPDPVNVLGYSSADGGGYVDLDGDGSWWIPSGRIFYSYGSNDTAADELAYSRQNFFLPVRYCDPFHTDQFITETRVSYDKYNLLVEETTDPLGNTVRAVNDYRMLQPKEVIDPNQNHTEAVFDALGLLVGTAVKGKVYEDGSCETGDNLKDFVADLTSADLNSFFTSPRYEAAKLLNQATTRIIYDIDSYYLSSDPSKPAYAATLARELHFKMDSGKASPVQVSVSYSDGFSREIQRKIQAEPGKVEIKDNDGSTSMVDTTPDVRWVASGWTIFNNKGKPVRQYEPFFSVDHRFQFGNKVGASPILFYDPIERVIAILHPNNTYEKVVFDPWHQVTWDVNDTVLLNPKTDPDIAGYMAGYFASKPNDWKTWLNERIADPLNPSADSHGQKPEQDAAVRTMAHAETPAVAYLDSLGRIFLTIADNGPDKNATVRKYRTRIKLDIENNQREVIDAKDRIVMKYDYDMLGNRIHQASMEAGERWILNDISGKALYAWDSRGHRFRTIYDQLRRPTGSYLLEEAGQEILIGQTVHGESQPDPEASNLRLKPYQVYDQAGIVTTSLYDEKGNLKISSRRLCVEYKNTIDWSKAIDLEEKVYTGSTEYDAMGRPVTLTTPDASVIYPSYNQANLLEKIEAKLRGANELKPFITNINYNAKGQRELIEYGILDGEGNNNLSSTYKYDEKTFRLTQIRTVRNAGDLLQSLSYFYDPAGNITYIRDDAQQTIFFKNSRVEPSSDYTYDALYRLIEARGREHLGQTAGKPNAPSPPDSFNSFHMNHPLPSDLQAMGNYIERYIYDEVGNISSMNHQGSDPANSGWNRIYSYGEASLLEPGKKSNRLSSTRVGQTTENYAYEGSAGLHGNITSMPHLQVMRWDYHDQLQATSRQSVKDGGIPELTWYVYDSGGQRVRKVTESSVTANDAAAGKTPVRMKERIYLGGFEVYREYNNSGGKTLERESLHIIDDKRRVALVETKTIDNSVTPPLTNPETLIRYQFDNHLGSACLEVDEKAQLISYEEYYPYGSTSYQAVSNSIEVSIKRYRYTGKERDEENGFNYHGARYYAPWLGRWVSCDPDGLVDGNDLFQYVQLNPIRMVDPNGTRPIDECLTISKDLRRAALNQQQVHELKYLVLYDSTVLSDKEFERQAKQAAKDHFTKAYSIQLDDVSNLIKREKPDVILSIGHGSLKSVSIGQELFSSAPAIKKELKEARQRKPLLFVALACNAGQQNGLMDELSLDKGLGNFTFVSHSSSGHPTRNSHIRFAQGIDLHEHLADRLMGNFNYSKEQADRIVSEVLNENDNDSFSERHHQGSINVVFRELAVIGFEHFWTLLNNSNDVKQDPKVLSLNMTAEAVERFSTGINELRSRLQKAVLKDNK